MKSKHKRPAPGIMVNVNGHDMHVYLKGKYTYVFLSGGGTRYPTEWSGGETKDKRMAGHPACSKAMVYAFNTRCRSFRFENAQPTTMREYKSITTHRYRHPSVVGI